MHLTEELYLKLLNLPTAPPETGGLIGEKNNIGIKIFLDKNKASKNFSYTPNTDLLNKVIHAWSKNGITLLGIFHTHVKNGFELSEQDKVYIENIIKSNNLSSLYFPLVIPPNNVVAYKAIFTDNEVKIIREKILLHKGDV